MTNTTITKHRPAGRVTALCVGLMSLMFVSCEMPPSQDSLPDLSEIRTTRPTTENKTDAEGETVEETKPVSRVVALIHRIDMPLGASLEPVWMQVDERALPLTVRGKWMINGMRIGVLHADNARAFSDALPNMVGESRAKLIGSDYPSPIRITPRLRETVTVDLTDPPRSPTLYEAQGGRMQLLAKVGRDDDGEPQLELTPHHFKPKATLLPRSPLEKELDGETFEALTVKVPLPVDRAVIVGLYRPWSDEDVQPESTQPQNTNQTVSPSDTSKDTTEQTDTAAQPPKPAPPVTLRPDELPNHLGKSLMTGTRVGKPTQMLLIITAIDEQPNATPPDG